MAYFKTPPRVPTRAEVDACLCVTDNEDRARDHIIIAMAAMTGLRVHELVALDWGQMVTDAGNLRRRVELVPENTKHNVGGDIVIPEVLRWKLSRYRTWGSRRGLDVDGDAPLLVSRHGRRLSVRRVQQVWRAVQREAGIDRVFTTHALRHYFGTEVYRKTKDIRVTQVLLRHQSVSSTQIYAHVTARDVEEAVEGLF